MRIVLLGPSASGKGTQGRRLAASLGCEYLSTGALLRENIEQRTPLGLAAEPVLSRGDYISDETMCRILAEWLGKRVDRHGWVLDGFPRSLPQAEFLDRILSENSTALHAAVALEAPFDELLRRIRDRVECPDCRWSGQRADLTERKRCPKCSGPAAARADDGVENFRNRHAEFLALTIPAIDFYRNSGKLLSVSATAPKHEVSATILSRLEFKI